LLELNQENVMETLVSIPTPMRTLTGGSDEVAAAGGTVGDVIADLEKRYPGMKDRLLDEKGVRRFINIFVGDEDIRFLDGLKTELKSGDRISIIPAIAGGA
jgi:molybdopterin synthase sulfur carrier subunit